MCVLLNVTDDWGGTNWQSQVPPVIIQNGTVCGIGLT